MPLDASEILLTSVQSGDWESALDATHALRDDARPIARTAREVLVEGVMNELDASRPTLSDAHLERLLLLNRAGFLDVAAEGLDQMANLLVMRNREMPERAVRYARYRPNADACRGVLAQFAEAGQTETEARPDGTLSAVGGGTRVDGRRSLFRSAQEALLFKAAQRVFQGMVLVPNGALHAAIRFESIKGTLTREEAALFFRVLVDLVVFDPQDGMRPAWFIELDSPWHDSPESRERDRAKERMIGLAGCQVTRIRPAGSINLSQMIALLEAGIATGTGGSSSQSP